MGTTWHFMQCLQCSHGYFGCACMRWYARECLQCLFGICMLIMQVYVDRYESMYPMSAMSAVSAVSAMSVEFVRISRQCRFMWVRYSTLCSVCNVCSLCCVHMRTLDVHIWDGKVGSFCNVCRDYMGTLVCRYEWVLMATTPFTLSVMSSVYIWVGRE